jgi:hypothetical protein
MTEGASSVELNITQDDGDLQQIIIYYNYLLISRKNLLYFRSDSNVTINNLVFWAFITLYIFIYTLYKIEI